jgi:hypothetical protein
MAMAAYPSSHSSDDDMDDVAEPMAPPPPARPPPLPRMPPQGEAPIPVAQPFQQQPRARQQNYDELREWLGVAPADIPCWFSIFALVGMFVIDNDAADVTLAIIAVAAASLAWGIALRTKPNVSAFTNVVRMVSYPANLLITFAAIAFHYWYWRG